MPAQRQLLDSTRARRVLRTAAVGGYFTEVRDRLQGEGFRFLDEYKPFLEAAAYALLAGTCPLARVRWDFESKRPVVTLVDKKTAVKHRRDVERRRQEVAKNAAARKEMEREWWLSSSQ